MEINKKPRVAHAAKFKPQEYAKRSKFTEDRKVKQPKVIASGCVIQKPILLVRSSSDDEDTSDSRGDFVKSIQLGLRPRSEKTNYEESYISFKALKDGLDSQEFLKRKNQANNNNKVDNKRPKTSMSSEEEQKSLKRRDRANEYPRTYVRPSKNTVDWDYYIQNPDNLTKIPPVDYFAHAPLVEIWNDIAKVGISFELRNPFVDGSQDVFWLATVVHFAGYKAMVKFESFREVDDDSDTRNYLAWISFCSNVPRHLGWCKENGYKLQPGPVVDESMSKEELEEHIEEFMKRETVSRNHEEKLYHAIRDKRKFNPASPVEVMDKEKLTQNRLGRISTISGNRVHVAYYEDQRFGEKRKRDGSHGFWYHFAAETIHPLGWSHTVGVKLKGIPERTILPHLPSNQFPQYPKDQVKIRPGMFLETRHPIKLNMIVGAEIIETYREGHFMLETREVSRLSRARFIYHVTSPFVLPIGFGERNGLNVDTAIPKERAIRKRLRLDLLPPVHEFYQLFVSLNSQKPSHKFQKGFKLESIDILDPFYLTPATVLRVAEHLLYLHADGFCKKNERNYQWVDVETSDIYPCGYREMMGVEWHGALDDQVVL